MGEEKFSHESNRIIIFHFSFCFFLSFPSWYGWATAKAGMGRMQQGAGHFWKKASRSFVIIRNIESKPRWKPLSDMARMVMLQIVKVAGRPP